MRLFEHANARNNPNRFRPRVFQLCFGHQLEVKNYTHHQLQIRPRTSIQTLNMCSARKWELYYAILYYLSPSGRD